MSDRRYMHEIQGVAITGRNRTVPPGSVGRRPPTRVTGDDRRQTTPTDDSVQNNTSPLGGPVTSLSCR